MRSAIAATALVVVANGVVIAGAGRERARPATDATIEVCAHHLIGGPGSDEPPTLHLTLSHDSAPTPTGLDAAGLRALGFSEAAVGTVGTPRKEEHRPPFDRPAWVRLRQRDDPSRAFEAVAVAPKRDQLPPDSTSLVVPALVALRVQWHPPAPDSGHVHGAPTPAAASPGLVEPHVSELRLSRLHLDRTQVADLRAALPDTGSCMNPKQVVIAQGARGGLWVAGFPR